MKMLRNFLTPRALAAGLLAWLLVASLQKAKPSSSTDTDEMAGPLGV